MDVRQKLQILADAAKYDASDTPRARFTRIRRWHAVTLADLVRLRVPLRRARPFIVTADWRPTLLLDSARLVERVRPASQLSLFEAASSAQTGEL